MCGFCAVQTWCSCPSSHLSEAADICGVGAFLVKLHNPVLVVYCFLLLSPFLQEKLVGYFCMGQKLLLVACMLRDVFRQNEHISNVLDV